jgi:LPS-assembly lipoprotein
MSLLKRLCLAAGLLALAGLQTGCGFQPVYGGAAAGAPGSDVATELQQVAVDTVPDRVGHRLKTELQRLLGSQGQQSQYRLAIKLESHSAVTAIDRGDSVRRRNLRLVAAITLTPFGAEKPVYQRTVISDAGIDQLPSDFATFVAEDAAEQRAVERLARDIRQRLAVYFATKH